MLNVGYAVLDTAGGVVRGAVRLPAGSGRMFEIAGRKVGGDAPCFIVAEIGINHNGSLDLARQLIQAASRAGCDAVKFQKRTVDAVYTPAELAAPRDSPFGTTNGDLKRGLEFTRAAYERLIGYCERCPIRWFASAWDCESVEFLNALGVPCHKVPSALLTSHPLIETMVESQRPIILSTGMSTATEVDRAVRHCVEKHRSHALLACTAAYPATIDNLHLARLHTLHERYPHAVVGYSGHEVGVWTTLCAVALGAKIIERHITLDRSMWGSDQAASLEPGAFAKLVREIRDFERAYGTGDLRCLPCEETTKNKLRRAIDR